jgi:trehalose 6-phosphate synthase/phosphatase
MAHSIINVSNRLPITVDGDEIGKSSGGLVTAMEGLTGSGTQLQWIGWPGGVVEEPERQRQLTDRLANEFGYTPVFLTDAENRGFYEGFSNASLWPLLHYLPSYYRYEPEWWDVYRTVNQRFADTAVAAARDGDVVWVHDYQLMLVPAMIKRANPALRVGFFLHTPFPAYEIFRCHPRRLELVQGLLGADLVGFHTLGYLRHFRTAVQRLVGIESKITVVRQGERHQTHMGVYPIGINADKFLEEMSGDAFAKKVEEIRQSFGAKRLVLSVERLDYTKGILRRLEAIDRFLADTEKVEERDRIKFIFINVPSREGVEEYQELRAEVESLVGRINGRYATLQNSPIHFMHGSVSFTELCALYAAAEVGLVTPLIDGMNLVAKEYAICQTDERPGALVISEFAGAAQEMYGALIVNPYDAQQQADAIRQGLAMGDDEKRRRLATMRARVRAFDANAWAKSFINDLAGRARTDAAAVAPMADRVAQAKQRLREAVAGGRRVALFLDYDGTLREIEQRPADAFPSAPVLALLDRLKAAGAHVDVAVISGRTPQDLEAWLGGYPFALIADHGASLRHRGATRWERLDRNATYGWKQEVLRVLRLYEETTPGSTVEDKRTSLVWHYRQADHEFATWRARHLATELAVLLANEPVEVRQGRMIVEVAAAQVNKGAAVGHLLADEDYDLIVCAGDDVTDESMFELDAKNLLTIKVGDAHTSAQVRLPDPPALRRFLLEALG